MAAEERIRLFIGSSANGEDTDMEHIYEYTVRKHASLPVDIVWMRQTHDLTSFWSGWETSAWPTPFSGFRWGIPAYCNHTGRAIYTDEDMVNFRDLAELWRTDLKGRAIAARRGHRFGGHEFCVMVIDCERLGMLLPSVDRIKKIESMHVRLINMLSGSNEVTDLDPRWNCLDGEGLPPGAMYQLHWTNMATQPWRPAWYTGPVKDHPRQDLVALWHTLLQEARQSNVQPQRCGIDYAPFGPYTIIGR